VVSPGVGTIGNSVYGSTHPVVTNIKTRLTANTVAPVARVRPFVPRMEIPFGCFTTGETSSAPRVV
jgi:hypothetical protein